MNRTKLAAIATASVLAALGGPARAAHTWLADCANGDIQRDSVTQVSGLTASNTLGFSLLGTPTGPGQIANGPTAGDTIEINGICTEDVTVTTPGLVIVNHNNSDSFDSADGVQGQFEFSGTANTTIDGLLIGSASPFSFSGATTEVANLFVHDGAAISVKNSHITNGPLVGILVARASAADVRSSTISGNGSGATNSNSSMGILAESNATLYAGKSDGTASVTVQNNTGAGIVASDASSVVIYAATVSGNGLIQVAVLGASSGFVTGLNANTTQITAPSSGCCQAIFASGASTLDIEQGATVTGNQTKAAIGLNTSSLILQGSTATSGAGAGTPAKSEPTLHGTGNSVIALAGGNTVCFGSVGSPCTITNGGYALGVDHVSTLLQVSGAVLGYAQAADSVGGGGQVLLQSTADLGRGLISSSPSLSWTTGSGNIAVAQNSSFRLDGGVTLTGQINLAEASNGFFNSTGNGSGNPNGTNTVGKVLCSFVSVPAAHVSGPAAVSPSLTLAMTMDSATNGTCLPF